MEESLRSYIREHFPRQQNRIAEAAGISQSFMSDWMNRKRGISVKNYEALIAALSIISPSIGHENALRK